MILASDVKTSVTPDFIVHDNDDGTVSKIPIINIEGWISVRRGIQLADVQLRIGNNTTDMTEYAKCEVKRGIMMTIYGDLLRDLYEFYGKLAYAVRPEHADVIRHYRQIVDKIEAACGWPARCPPKKRPSHLGEDDEQQS